MTALLASISLSSSSSFFGQRLLWPRFVPPATVEKRDKPCLISSKLKRWERKECRPNSLLVLHKMHVKVDAPVHSSNVMLYSKDKEVAGCEWHKVLDDGSWVRYLIKTGEVIDSAENWKKLRDSEGKTEVAVAV